MWQDKPLSLLWLRRDLRLDDHAALAHALQSEGAVQPVFIFDTDILARFANPLDRRLTFIAETLRRLHAQLQKCGGGLLVLHGRPQEIVPTLCDALGANAVYAAEDYEPANKARDNAVADLIKGSAALHLVQDHVLQRPDAVRKDDGTPYKVFTPYYKAWLARVTPTTNQPWEVKDAGRYADFSHNAVQAMQRGLRVIDASASLDEMLNAIGYRKADISQWPVDSGQEWLAAFADRKMQAYKDKRDFPAIHGTSRLSPYMRFGLISIRACARAVARVPGVGGETWLKELVWRDFYQMILYHFPESASQEFQPAYRGIGWHGDKAHFKAFAEGRTGFPIIDAAMRELLQTGWMHNRMRMVVASFLTKDLLLDWRTGEEHFAQHLMDYELASNVGGWQWAASTGTDAQPYFRVFNPLLQSKKFDPDGDYIRAYVPELALLPTDDVHEPWKKAKPANYPAPIVDHAVMKEKAIRMFKEAGEKPV